MLKDGTYLDTPAQWDELVELCRTAGAIGLDSEFYGVDPSKQSCVGRSRIHVFSIAIRTERLSPLGFHYCRGWMLPVGALAHPPVVALLEGVGVLKYIHNQSVDHHSFANHGIQVGGGVNTLGWVRWTHPGLVNTPGRFKLKTLMNSLLRRNPVCSFKQLVTYERTEIVTKLRAEERSECSCGVDGCRKRKGHKKRKWLEEVEVSREKIVEDRYPLESIVPGHPRWDLLLRYAIDDAVAALQIAELAEAMGDPAPYPYVKSTPRPMYSQALEHSVITMEAAGFNVDVEWCTHTAARAETDKEKELKWLFRWWNCNAPYYGPHHRSLGLSTKQAKKHGVDSVWTSAPKKLALFDALGFPRSPIWAKGKIKRGDSSLDWKAMQWIAANHPEAKQVCEHLLKLGRIQSGLKYLVKLRDSGGTVHPICGPAGDDDERSGAVTGRLGIKGPLEAQQLPTDEDKDLYLVRRAIIA